MSHAEISDSTAILLGTAKPHIAPAAAVVVIGSLRQFENDEQASALGIE